jgi:hypothetical protein
MGRQRAILRLGGVASVLACATAAAGCGATKVCTEAYYFCNRTNITVQSPNNAWAQGSYTLAVDTDGTPTTCTLQMPTSAPLDGVPADCGARSPVTVSVVPIASCPKPVCYPNGSCEQMACTPIPGQFELAITIPTLASHVALNLSTGGKPLLVETLTPQATTTEPNGKGCGTCTNASAMASTAGM